MKTWIIVILVLILAILLGVFIWWMVTKDNSGSNNSFTIGDTTIQLPNNLPELLNTNNNSNNRSNSPWWNMPSDMKNNLIQGMALSAFADNNNNNYPLAAVPQQANDNIQQYNAQKLP